MRNIEYQTGEKPTSDRPNVLLLLTDQHSSRISGFSGDNVVRTQHLDALASRSVQFQTALCASPLCTPSRICLLTGKEAHRCSAWANHWAIFPEHVTWPGHFATHGYRTALIGKMHLGGRNQMAGFQHRPYGDLLHGHAHQPDPLEFYPGYPNIEGAGVTQILESLLQDVVVTRETLSWVLEHHARHPGHPWFACASYSRPHSPFTTPGRYFRRYQGKLPPLGDEESNSDHLEPFAQWVRDRLGSVTPEQAQCARKGYYANIDFVDDQIGGLLDELQSAGALDHTIIIYTSDHGEMAGQFGLWGKMVYYEPSVAVPLLMTGPGIKPGHCCLDHPTSLLDLFPTTCALAGLPIPEGLDGADLSTVLASPDSAPAHRKWVFSAIYGYGVMVRHADYGKTGDYEPYRAMRLVRDQSWKYVEVEGGRPLLFNLNNDPLESTNLANRSTHADRCRRMRDVLFADFSWEMVHERLKSDRDRFHRFRTRIRPTSPNQYMLPDGRMFDAEKSLYDARWLSIPPEATGGIVPQQFG